MHLQASFSIININIDKMATSPAFVWPPIPPNNYSSSTKRDYLNVIEDLKSLSHRTQWTDIQAMLAEVRSCKYRVHLDTKPRPY